MTYVSSIIDLWTYCWSLDVYNVLEVIDMVNFIGLFVLSILITSIIDSDIITILGYIFTFSIVNVILTYIFTEREVGDE